jgi:hypothetical protein
VVLVRKATDEIRISFFIIIGAQKINELAVTSNNLTNNFVGLVASAFEPDVACGPPFLPLCLTLYQPPAVSGLHLHAITQTAC